MYYWSKILNSTISLEEELLSVEDVKEVYIGTAYFSRKGISVLQDIVNRNRLNKESVHIILSEDFSYNEPHELLSALCKIATVRIISSPIFHSKIYLIKGKVNKIIFGSSNFTNGGFINNIEFNCINEIDENELKEIDRFFRNCKNFSNEVTESVIQNYKEHREKFRFLNKELNDMKKRITFLVNSDPLDPELYHIENFYFNLTDYETFYERNSQKDNMIIAERRKNVKNKLLAIHNKIYSDIRQLNIYCHWNPNHITSLDRPLEYNNYRVDWMCVRYGKHKKEIQYINKDKEYENEEFGFQKHACLQFCVIPLGFEISLFLAVPKKAIDRLEPEKIQDLESEITKEITKLKGYNFTWIIKNSLNQYTFEIDNRNPEDFCEFLRFYDRDNYISYLRKFYYPNDNALKDLNSLSNEILNYIKLLLPLYNTIVWRPSVN